MNFGSNQTESAYLSPRAFRAIKYGAGWRKMNSTVLSKPYDKDKSPDGVINMVIAENFLTHQELKGYLEKNFTIEPLTEMTYGQGPAGSPRLRKALPSFFNTRVRSFKPAAEDEIIVSSGITSLIDSMAWCLCAENEGIILPEPLYSGFSVHVGFRSSAHLIPASFGQDNLMSSFDQAFDSAATVEALGRTLFHSTEQGIQVRGVMITNPHNPLGRCYTREMLREIARFCGSHKLHFISDGRYSQSVYTNKAFPNATKFTSVLSLDLDGIINPNLVHILYGMSKDFGANGFRLGTPWTPAADCATTKPGIVQGQG